MYSTYGPGIYLRNLFLLGISSSLAHRIERVQVVIIVLASSFWILSYLNRVGCLVLVIIDVSHGPRTLVNMCGCQLILPPDIMTLQAQGLA